MIHAFNFTCHRDFDLSVLMMSTFLKYCPDSTISTTNTDTSQHYKGYGNGSGWPQAMMKVKALSDIVKTKNVQDTDFVLSVDSDVVFCSPEVFNYINPDYGIIGTKHRPNFHTALGDWSHMSGATIYIRGDIAKKIAALDETETNKIRFQHFKPYRLTENEDVVLSYLAGYVGANYFDLGEIPGLSSGDFEEDVKQFKKHCDFFQLAGGAAMLTDKGLKSFYHLNYCPTFFLGEPVAGKWDIARVLKMKGIQL